MRVSRLQHTLRAAHSCMPGPKEAPCRDSAFTVSPSMITPSNNDPALDDFDFYQSSNRMAIECAFGILIRRWGVLWRKLRQRFDRRAPLIGALMRLHNFCIDERLIDEDDLPDVHAQFTEVQPDRYCRPPLFDKDGRPVEYLQTAQKDAEGAPPRDRAQGKGERFARRDEHACSSSILKQQLGRTCTPAFTRPTVITWAYSTFSSAGRRGGGSGGLDRVRVRTAKRTSASTNNEVNCSGSRQGGGTRC